MNIGFEVNRLKIMLKLSAEVEKLRKENAELKTQLKESEEAYAILQKMRSEA